MARFKDVEWNLQGENGNIATWEGIQIAVLMDIRDELKSLNGLLRCQNFLQIPTILREIRRNTARPRRKPKKLQTETKR
jgi:hypothetical protein